MYVYVYIVLSPPVNGYLNYIHTCRHLASHSCIHVSRSPDKPNIPCNLAIHNSAKTTQTHPHSFTHTSNAHSKTLHTVRYTKYGLVHSVQKWGYVCRRLNIPPDNMGYVQAYVIHATPTWRSAPGLIPR